MPGGDELHGHGDPGDGVDLVADPVAQRDHLAHLVREALAANLDGVTQSASPRFLG